MLPQDYPIEFFTLDRMFDLRVLKSESQPSSDIGFLSDDTKPRQQL